MKPLFSIVIPTLNSERTIQGCLDSVLNQEFNNYEILIIDGLSEDNTLSIVNSYNDLRIKIYSEPDKGVYDAMNKGIKKSQGDWLYFLGSDDTLYDNYVLSNVSNKIFPNVKVIYGNVYINEKSMIYDGVFNKHKICIRNICHQSIFYHRMMLRKLNGFNIKYKIFADWDLNIKWILRKRIEHLYIPIIIANYSINGYSSLYRDEVFLCELPQKLIYYGIKQYSFKELKELAHRTFIIKNSERKIFQCYYYKFLIILFRLSDMLKRIFI